MHTYSLTPNAFNQFLNPIYQHSCYNIYRHTAIVYSGHVEYDKNNDITSLKVNATAPWSCRGPSEHNLEPDDCKMLLNRGCL